MFSSLQNRHRTLPFENMALFYLNSGFQEQAYSKTQMPYKMYYNTIVIEIFSSVV